MTRKVFKVGVKPVVQRAQVKAVRGNHTQALREEKLSTPGEQKRRQRAWRGEGERENGRSEAGTKLYRASDTWGDVELV